jgi:hypothetical protein
MRTCSAYCLSWTLISKTYFPIHSIWTFYFHFAQPLPREVTRQFSPGHQDPGDISLLVCMTCSLSFFHLRLQWQQAGCTSLCTNCIFVFALHTFNAALASVQCISNITKTFISFMAFHTHSWTSSWGCLSGAHLERACNWTKYSWVCPWITSRALHISMVQDTVPSRTSAISNINAWKLWCQAVLNHSPLEILVCAFITWTQSWSTIVTCFTVRGLRAGWTRVS